MTTFDREAVLRKAEKLLRVGKLEQATAQYEQVVRECPDDVATGALLGNLYLRAGTPERAVEHFTQIADGLRTRGLLTQAAGAYRRVLAIASKSPDARSVVTNCLSASLDRTTSSKFIHASSTTIATCRAPEASRC